MKTSIRGFSIIELLTALAVSSILLVSTVPLGAHWIGSSHFSSAVGAMSQGIGKAIATALRNEQALDSSEPVAALCISDTHQLTVLQASSTDLPNCEDATGTTVWNSPIPDDIDVKDGSNTVSCFCFTSRGLLTTNNCTGCSVSSMVTLNIGDRQEALYVR